MFCFNKTCRICKQSIESCGFEFNLINEPGLLFLDFFPELKDSKLNQELNHICEVCFDQLLKFEEFKSHCIKSDEQFLQYSKQLEDTGGCRAELVCFIGMKYEIIEDVEVVENFGTQLFEAVIENDVDDDFDRKLFETDDIDQKLFEVVIENDIDRQLFEIVDDKSLIKLEEPIEDIPHVEYKLVDQIDSQYAIPEITPVPKVYDCDECGKKFAKKANLKLHKRTHSGEKPYKCTECGKVFAQSSHLTCHRQSHMNIKPFICDKCGKRFSQNKYLKIHLRNHTGEKPYKCHECGKSFARKDIFMSHRRIHTGERPFRCDQCGQMFTYRSNLVTHMTRHTGKKVFQCNECEKAFTRKENLNKHQRVHTSGISL